MRRADPRDPLASSSRIEQTQCADEEWHVSEGLRERKARLNRRRMEKAAVDLAYEEGIGAVTVARVCSVAGVSRSTFFNYFPSLEEAIFGPPLEYDPALAERLLTTHHADLVVAASLIVTETVRGQTNDDVTRRRLTLFAREPGTTSAVSWASYVSRERLIDVIRAWLDAHPELSRLPGEDSSTEARLIVAMSISIADEGIRELQEVDGDLVIDAEPYRRARRRLAAILAEPEGLHASE